MLRNYTTLNTLDTITVAEDKSIILDLSGNGIDDFKISVIEIYDNLATVEMEKLEENQMITK